MKTAISIPDDVFDEADRLAKRLGISRSHLYAKAVAEYVDRHDPDSITDAMNRVIDAVGDEPDPALQAAAIETLKRLEW